MKNTLLFICSTNILVRLLTVNMKNCLTPKNPKMCDPILVTLLKMRPHYNHSSHENATPSSGTSPLACYKEVPSPPSPPQGFHSNLGWEWTKSKHKAPSRLQFPIILWCATTSFMAPCNCLSELSIKMFADWIKALCNISGTTLKQPHPLLEKFYFW